MKKYLLLLCIILGFTSCYKQSSDVERNELADKEIKQSETNEDLNEIIEKCEVRIKELESEILEYRKNDINEASDNDSIMPNYTRAFTNSNIDFGTIKIGSNLYVYPDETSENIMLEREQKVRIYEFLEDKQGEIWVLVGLVFEKDYNEFLYYIPYDEIYNTSSIESLVTTYREASNIAEIYIGDPIYQVKSKLGINYSVTNAGDILVYTDENGDELRIEIDKYSQTVISIVTSSKDFMNTHVKTGTQFEDIEEKLASEFQLVIDDFEDTDFIEKYYKINDELYLKLDLLPVSDNNNLIVDKVALLPYLPLY
jgi:hypothetical protein